MANLGTAYVKIAPSMQGMQAKVASGFKGSGTVAGNLLSDELDKSAGSRIPGIFSKIGKGIATGIGVGTIALTGLVGKSVMAAAELEQQLGGSEAVFGKFSDTIKKRATSAYQTMGLSQNEFLAGANKMASLLQGSGVDIEKSMTVSMNAMQRASDVASVMGIDTATALEAVTGAAKGNYTMMDNLGVAMNDTSLSAAAMEKAAGKSWKTMSQGEKVLFAQQYFLEKTAKYAGNYAKENETLAGSLNTTKKAFQDFLATGKGENFIGSLIDTIKIAGKEVIRLAPMIIDGLVTLATELVPVISQMLPTVLPVLINGAIQIINGLVTAMPQIIQALMASLPAILNGVVQITMAIVQALPQIISLLVPMIPQIIDTLVETLTNPEMLALMIKAGIDVFVAIIKALPQIITSIVGAIPTIISNIVQALTNGDVLFKLASAGITIIDSLIRGIGSMVTGVWNAAIKIIDTIVSVLKPSSLLDIGTNLVKGLWNGISNATSWILNQIKGFGSSILKGIKSIFGINSPSKKTYAFGEFISEGLANGITDSLGVVTSAVDDLGRQALNEMAGISPTVDATYKASAQQGNIAPLSNQFAQGSGVVNKINNFNIEQTIDSTMSLKQVNSDLGAMAKGL